ncbi:MAG: hypothetical protein JW755_02240 [Candidatus Aminicenantes bacterium]|nr:hypothetical protein [Candidatus Aminicenantes bacterium]
MNKKTKKISESVSEYAKEIFISKNHFHKAQAKLPIEEKIRILIELQKLVMKTQKQDSKDELRFVWKI